MAAEGVSKGRERVGGAGEGERDRVCYYWV